MFSLDIASCLRPPGSALPMSQLRVEDGQLVYTMMVYATEGDRACLAQMGDICAVPEVDIQRDWLVVACFCAI